MLGGDLSKNKAVIKEWFEAVWNGSVPSVDRNRILDSIIAADHPVGIPGVKASWQKLHDEYRNIKAEISDQFGEDNQVCTRLTVSAERENSARTWSAIYIHRLEDGKIVDYYSATTDRMKGSF
jgi:SnoaL-like domain